MEMTRRELALIAVGSASFLAQAPPPAGAGRDWDREARQSRRENAEALARFDIQMQIEPAFQFRA